VRKVEISIKQTSTSDKRYSAKAVMQAVKGRHTVPITIFGHNFLINHLREYITGELCKNL